MNGRRRWSLGARLVLVAMPFMLLTLLAIAVTLLLSRQLEAGAAAINDAGRLRMQVYRMSLSSAAGDRQVLSQQMEALERSLSRLAGLQSDTPLLPEDAEGGARGAAVRLGWSAFRRALEDGTLADLGELRMRAAALVGQIDAQVDAIEAYVLRRTALQHLLQVTVLVLVVTGGATLMLTGYRFILEPVSQLREAIERLQGGDFGARVGTINQAEFAALGSGFNQLADHLQSMYRNLEAKVAEKTIELEQKGERLGALYDMTTLIAGATSLDELAKGFTRHIAHVARADGVVLRWTDEANRRYLLLASHGVPKEMLAGEQCLPAGACHCGAPQAPAGVRVIPIRSLPEGSLKHCAKADFETVVSLPIRLHQRTMGEVNLLYDAQVEPSPAEKSLLEALTAHLCSAMENLRLDGLAKEAALCEERNLLARELHDSIAQSLAFLKIQVRLMRDALAGGDAARVESVLGEIDAGVRESYGDVRELLVHFRTRISAEQIEPALQAMLRKFEHQSGVVASLWMEGQGLPMPPDLQIQVLHILQEALSNVRKHANATRVWLDVRQQPHWRFEVRDNGRGFVADEGALGENHIGSRIMAERAERIGATLTVNSVPGTGTSVMLQLPAGMRPGGFGSAPVPQPPAPVMVTS